jgi:hypothetical protein
MRYYKIVIRPFDTSADAYIRGTLEGHAIGNETYILDIDMSEGQVERHLRETADNVEVVEILQDEFERLSREKLGFYAPKP